MTVNSNDRQAWVVNQSERFENTQGFVPCCAFGQTHRVSISRAAQVRGLAHLVQCCTVDSETYVCSRAVFTHFLLILLLVQSALDQSEPEQRGVISLWQRHARCQSGIYFPFGFEHLNHSSTGPNCETHLLIFISDDAKMLKLSGKCSDSLYGPG